MPIVFRFGPYRFGFFASDHDEPPHIHVRREKKRAKFWLTPDVRLAGNQGFAAHELNMVKKVVIDHRAYFLECWNEFFEE